MSSTNKTTNYNLSQFVGTDIPSILNDYNGDMQKIDTAVHNVSVAGGDNATAIASLQGTVSGHTSQITQLDSNVINISGKLLTAEGNITELQNKIYRKKLIVTATGTFDEKCATIENAINALDVNDKIGCVLAFNLNGQRNIMPISYITSANYSFTCAETIYSSSTQSINTVRRQINVGTNGYTYNGLMISYNLQTNEISDITHTDKTLSSLASATFELYA